MTTVYKYELPFGDTADVMMPDGARVLHVGTQGEVVFMWALVDPEAPEVLRQFYVRGTGHPMGAAEGLEHLGTFMLMDGIFVGHVFGVREQPPQFRESPGVARRPEPGEDWAR